MPASTPRRKSLESRVKDFIKAHPLHLMFMADAVLKLSDAVTADESATREQMKNHIISPEAWIAAAKSAKASFDTTA